MPTFDNHDRAKHHVRNCISNSITDDVFAETVAEACLAEYKKITYPSPPPGALGLMRARVFWAIRDDDLKASDVFWKALAAAGGINFFQSSLTASAVVGILSAAFSAYHAVRKYGIQLTVEQTQVLVALKKLQEPSTPEEIGISLGLPVEAINENLSTLRNVRRADGSMVSVVALDNEGRWTCAGI